MRRIARAISAFLCLGLVALAYSGETAPVRATSQQTSKESYHSPGFQVLEKGLNASEKAGQIIWFYATAGNARFHTSVFQQRLGVLIDWYKVLNSRDREQRFTTWGLINNPDCCKPGTPGCPAKSFDETYGFDWCPGDEVLLEYVGKTGYRDPACDFEDAPILPNDVHGPEDQRQSSCDLEFGTSTGALGVQKFPNPRFDRDQWLKINGGKLGTWAGYNTPLSEDKTSSDSKVTRLSDGSIEPPFLIGMACGSCHIAFDPLNPPKDPANPKWANISGTVANQYSRFSQILGSGMPRDTIEYQIFAHARPGIVDTSAVPNDQVTNPGTINAIINTAARPGVLKDSEVFLEEVDKWRPVKACPAGANERSCWCEPGRKGKCWEKSKKKEKVPHVLKGGEDSIGIVEAIQRVYINIGSCSESGWVNHLTDLRQLDPTQRNYGQTPVDIGQLRRDCANFRAIEDRRWNIAHFLLSGGPTDLYKARGLDDVNDLVEQLDRKFGLGAVDRGRVVFAKTCAKCHSSREGPFEAMDVRDTFTDDGREGLRKDWLGNDQLIPVSEVGTNYSRALHSNHMQGHVWEEFGSETLRAKPADPNVIEPSDGGRGYYRNISLLNLWAHAPFLHNNAIGPELCGRAGYKDHEKKQHNDQHYNAPYVDPEYHPRDGGPAFKRHPDPPDCWVFAPSVEGRYKLYKASMDLLLNPNKRIPKVTLLDTDVGVHLGPKVWDGKKEKPIGITIIFPKDMPAASMGNFRHKELGYDLWLLKTDRKKLRAKYVARYGEARGERVVEMLIEKLVKIGLRLIKDHEYRVAVDPELREIYSNSMAFVENQGHTFGEDLSAGDKKALTAFLATL